MILILAEKAEVAEAISAALNISGRKKSNNSILQGNYLITWLSGHILTLKAPEDYNPELKRWTIESLPISFPNWDTKPLEDDWKQRQFQNICKWLKECDKVIHAGDPDQEGQLLVDEVLKKAGYTGSVLRLDTSDTTVKGLQRALHTMENNDKYIPRGDSAYARSVADFLVGINISRLFSCLNPGYRLTFGRVQTPTLGLVVNRDMLIENHQKITYYTITVPLSVNGCKNVIDGKYEPFKDDPVLTDGKILNKKDAEQRAAQLSKRHFSKTTLMKKTVKENPPLPFNLVKLQSYCSKKFGYNLEQTLNATQELRDRFAAITYNRSAFQYLNDNHYAEAPETMATVVKNIGFAPKKLDMSLKSEAFNNELYGEHPAIIPQNTELDLTKMTEIQKNVYLAICQFYMAQFLPPSKKEVTQLIIDLGKDGKIVASSSKFTELGYLSIFKDRKTEKENELSSLNDLHPETDTGDCRVEEKETKPPARYTQATLAEDMTCISKYVTDKRIKQIMRDKDKGSKEDNGSIGTVATRTPIIKNLISRGFIEDDGKHLKSTPLGRELYRILPEEIKGVNITAEWWLVCEDIVARKATPHDLQNQVLKTISKIISERDTYPKVDAAVVPSDSAGAEIGRCPKCGKSVVKRKQGFVCVNRNCNFIIWQHSKSPVLKDLTLSDAQVRKLLDGKAVHSKKLYSPKKDTHFEADLRLVQDTQAPSGYGLKLEFPAPNSKPSGTKTRRKS